MKIVIDIPEEEYRKVQDGRASVSMMRNAIKNGTLLPKGHGKIIDVNDLLDRICLDDTDENREDNVGEIITLEDIDFISAIIEADSGKE